MENNKALDIMVFIVSVCYPMTDEMKKDLRKRLDDLLNNFVNDYEHCEK